MLELLAATALFVGGHFVLSSHPLRASLVARLGEGPFRGLYALVALVGLVWMIFAYRALPEEALWTVTPALRWLAVLVMPFALFLLIAANTTKSPTRIGAELKAGEVVTVSGVLRITRHPLMWAMILWALTHLLANGDRKSLVLMGGILVLAVGGMLHIDRRREATFGAAWGPVALSTSILPFAAIAAGRTSMDWAGIGWWRVGAALATYAAFLFGHAWLFGVSALP
jgi:uncharacterized membrane protein